jgi:hypothetical protein
VVHWRALRDDEDVGQNRRGKHPAVLTFSLTLRLWRAARRGGLGVTALVGLVMTDGATGGSAESTMAGQMTGNAAYDCSLDAAFGVGRSLTARRDSAAIAHAKVFVIFFSECRVASQHHSPGKVPSP